MGKAPPMYQPTGPPGRAEVQSLTRAEFAVLDTMLDRLSRCKSLVDCVRSWCSFCVPAYATGARFAPSDALGGRSVGEAGELANAPIVYSVIDDGFTIGALLLSPAQNSGRAFSLALCERAATIMGIVAGFERERNVSWAFQHAALSTELPVIQGYRFDAVYQAGRAEAQVGGDWYDVFSTADGRIVISVGDVLGSGLHAAVAMLAVRQAIRGVAEVYANPVLMVKAADRIMRTQHPERFVTLVVGVVDPATQIFTYVNAGHPSPLIREEDGQIRALRACAPPIGLPFDLDADFEAQSSPLPSGSVFLAYTDGLVEHSQDIIAGERALYDVFATVDPAAGSIATYLYNTLLPRHARDDVAILSVAVNEHVPILRWRFNPQWSDVALRARAEIESHLLTDAGMDEGCLFNFRMIFAELVANIKRHAPGTVTFILQCGQLPVLHVLDKGQGFYCAPNLPNDLFSEAGRGLFLISNFAERFSVEPRAGGGSHTRVTLKVNSMEKRFVN